MATPTESKSRASRVFCFLSVIVGVIALGTHLAYEVSRADLGTNLGLDAPGTTTFLHWASLPVAVVGLFAALTAMIAAPTWKLRFGAPLPGLLANGAALAWWFLG